MVRKLLQAILCVTLCPLLAAQQGIADVKQQALQQPAPAPSPAPLYAQAPAPPSARWFRIEQFSDGQQIVVRTADGNQAPCRFAGATDTALFCDPPGPLASQTGYRFDRASILSVRESRPPSDLHPGLLVAMAIVGAAFGVGVSRNTSNQTATAAGLIAAGFTGAIGYGMPQMQGQNEGFGMAFPLLEFGRGAPRPLGLRPRMPMPIRPMRFMILQR